VLNDGPQSPRADGKVSDGQLVDRKERERAKPSVDWLGRLVLQNRLQDVAQIWQPESPVFSLPFRELSELVSQSSEGLGGLCVPTTPVFMTVSDAIEIDSTDAWAGAPSHAYLG
jgi:hypothetical protein